MNILSNASRDQEFEVWLHEKRYFVLGSPAPFRNLIYFDSVMFTLVLLVTLAFISSAAARGTLHYDWQYRLLFTSARTIYALTAFPYFFASCPPWDTIFCHANPTASDSFHVCPCTCPNSGLLIVPIPC